MSTRIFQTALGITPPWFVATVAFDEAEKALRIEIDSERGSRFQVTDLEGEHPVHDTAVRRYRRLNFFRHECFLHVRVPRVKLPDGSVRLVQADSSGAPFELASSASVDCVLGA